MIVLDQRSHGRSERGNDHSRSAYVEDAAAFIQTLDLGPLIVLGHSMGGVNAYQLAARHPDLVRALVIEEAGAVVREPVLDVRGWPRRTTTIDGLRAAIEAHGIPDASYFLDSAVEYDDGWGLLCDYDAMMASQYALLGDWWSDWLASTCPALLLHGQDSAVLTTELAREMAAQRPLTELREFPGCGHFVHDDDPEEFARAVAGFLAGLERS